MDVGDSGGPLQMPLKSETDYTFLQVGIVSHGKPCKFTGQTCTVGGYTKVAFYIPWIDSIIWK
ncbi:serine-type endopeptidase [Sarracenia purpurea var. burkii]